MCGDRFTSGKTIGLGTSYKYDLNPNKINIIKIFTHATPFTGISIVNNGLAAQKALYTADTSITVGLAIIE